MFERYFDEYYVSESDLKVKLNKIVQNLIGYLPDVYSNDLISQTNPDLPTETIFKNLSDSIPEIRNISPDFESLSIIEQLRLITIYLDKILHTAWFNIFVPKLFFINNSTFFKHVEFIVISDIAENRNAKFKYNNEELKQELSKLSNNEATTYNSFEIIRAVNDEINLFLNNETEESIIQLLKSFEESVESYIKNNLDDVIFESFKRISFEAIYKNGNLIDEVTGKNQDSDKEKKQIVDVLLKFARMQTNYRLGRKHGGKRNRDGFSWSNDNKIQFFNEVENIPKITRRKNGQRESINVWEYIYEQFDARGLEAKELLKADPNIQLIPFELLDEAFEVWNKFEIQHKNISSESSPKMFLYRNALQNLDFPTEYFNSREHRVIAYKKTTLQKYFDLGKELSSTSDNQDET